MGAGYGEAPRRPYGSVLLAWQRDSTRLQCSSYTPFSSPHASLRRVYVRAETERLKLSRSMGFCPHLRCQLGDVGNANSHGACPPGLCYTKVEAGAPTFGACCFSDGVFNSGSILGYYRLLRATPKPIYKRNRVVLGPDPHDESAVRIAHFGQTPIHPHMCTQVRQTCPL